MITVRVERLIEDDAGNQVVILRDPETGMQLPIWIGDAEAFAIQKELEGLHMPRPMTHDLMRDILRELGIQLLRVEITDIQDNTFYACLVLRGNGRIQFVDARPSDAIALALRMDAPIYVSETVARIAGHFPKPDHREIERFLRLTKDLDLPD
ncbi:MAG: bifunctional nuclease family protein [Armatimonadetes bacterium]|nr:bifunctional nuclease family protein [Armatimonadota bacterium]MDW8122670.1 bifunctional nuclease family protein [Armatimonadota bacterium]